MFLAGRQQLLRTLTQESLYINAAIYSCCASSIGFPLFPPGTRVVIDYSGALNETLPASNHTVGSVFYTLATRRCCFDRIYYDDYAS